MKLKIISLLMVIALVALTACSPSTTTDEVDTTIQEEAVEVGERAEDGAPPEELVEEVEDVIERLPADGAPASDAVLDGYGVTYLVNGERFTTDVAPVLGETPFAGYLTVTSPDSLGIQLRTLPNEVGTYVAGQGPDFRLVDVWFPHQGVRYDANADVGSATIVVTEVGTLGWPYQGDIAGTFEGTFVASDGSELVVTNGEFRGTGPVY